jgi:hypothetical protein
MTARAKVYRKRSERARGNAKVEVSSSDMAAMLEVARRCQRAGSSDTEREVLTAVRTHPAAYI